jgi:NitT/TauT family transport system ATP-binding protein
MAMLEVRSLVKNFSRNGAEIPAINELNLSVNESEFITIVGPSGCGKSTFLHIIGGFISKNGGSIQVNGNEVTGPGTDRGVMFQEFALYPWRSVIGNVCWGLEVQGVPKQQRLATAEKYLSLVGLSKFKDHYPHELSGGMKQRVAMARLLAFDPKVLLMDEPFGSLDAQTRELMQEELNKIWESTRKTVLFVTHDIEEAIYLGDKVFVFTARPGTIKEVVEIRLPRPRRIEIKKSKDFHDYRDYVWDLLRDEVLKARSESEA